MTPHQIELVQSSFAQVIPVAQEAAGSFYSRLFEVDPPSRDLFKGDLEEQGYKLMEMLQLIVTGLASLDTLLPTVEALARRHLAYGVKREQYRIVGDVLLWTLRQHLGSAFTPQVEIAWQTAYFLLSTVIKKAAYK